MTIGSDLDARLKSMSDAINANTNNLTANTNYLAGQRLDINQNASEINHLKLDIANLMSRVAALEGSTPEPTPDPIPDDYVTITDNQYLEGAIADPSVSAIKIVPGLTLQLNAFRNHLDRPHLTIFNDNPTELVMHDQGRGVCPITFKNIIFSRPVLIYQRVKDITFEKCIFKKGINIQGNGSEPITDLIIEWCQILDNYISPNQHNQGIYLYNYDGVIIRYNIIDHNGWRDTRDSSATMFNHSIYLSGPGNDILVEKNIISRSSSHGIQMRRGGILKDNIFLNNPISWEMGHGGDGYSDLYGPVYDAQVTGNVAIGAADINSNLPRGQFGWIANCEGLEIIDNIAYRNGTSHVNNTMFTFDARYPLENVLVQDNKADTWGGLYIGPPGSTEITEIGNDYNYSPNDIDYLDRLKHDNFIENLRQTGLQVGQVESILDRIRSM